MRRIASLPANALIGGVLVGVLILIITVSVVWSPYDPLAIDLDRRLCPPSGSHWLGTDEFGRDEFSRAAMGARVSGVIALASVSLAISIGVAVGAIAGFMRGWTDRTLMSLNDALLAFPGVLLALAVIAVIGGSASSLTLALGLAYLPAVVRVVRSAVLSIREREYIEASRVMGNPEWVTLLRHVLPNAVAPIAVLATSMVGWVLLAESGLSFLGLGIAPPTPTWGNMLASGRPYFETAIWLSLAPGGFIALTLLGVNLLGDALRDRLDPRRSR